MPSHCAGRYLARLAQSDQDMQAVLALRSQCFRAGGDDHDALDTACDHVMVIRQADGQLVCTFRMLPLSDGREIGRSYAALHYELNGLQTYPGKMVELGRFCSAPDVTDPDILRMAWGRLTRYVDDNCIELLFGCSSFHGTQADAYLDTFAMLHDRHMAPKRWRPRVKAPRVFRFAELIRGTLDRKSAMRAMPPMLKTYLGMGGWVSDHAVVDHDLNTLHVFTGVEIAAIPPARAKALRAVAM
ncbi:MAG: GNAT family N-acyltransferase [Pseudomonadota bacterium]